MKHRNILLFSSLFISGLVFRKCGWNFGSVLIVISGLLLSLLIVWSSIRSWKTDDTGFFHRLGSSWLIPGLAFFLLLFQQQYWFYGYGTSILSLFLLTFITILRVLHYLRNSVTIPWKEKFYQGCFLIFCWMLVIPAVFLNQRQFHNLFRATKYEEYILNSLPLSQSDLADQLIDQYADYSPESREKSVMLYDEALKEASLLNYRKAIRLLNRAIDCNPRNEQAYFQRGAIKFYHLDIDVPVANSAIKDFSRCIRIKPGMAEAWMQRGIIYAYLEKPDQVCADMKMAGQLDTSLSVKFYLKKYCRDSGRIFPE